MTAEYAPVAEGVLAEAGRVLRTVEPASTGALLAVLDAGRRVFVTGEGRSGLVARMVAMRLVHTGRTAYVVGESTTPAIGRGDLLLACSGSGRSETTLVLARRAGAAGAVVAAVTADAEAPLAELADVVVTLAAPTKEARGDHRSVQFAGSLFEQCALLYLDAVVALLAAREGRSAEEMWQRHANLA